MLDDEEYRRLARREAAQRAERILRALRSVHEDARRWSDVHREAHTIAGIAPELDAELARDARRLVDLLASARGDARAPAPEDEAEARRLGERIGARAAALHQA